MTWVKLDDGFHINPKVRRAWKGCRASVGLYAMGLSYCAQLTSDGHLDDIWVAEQLPARDRDRASNILVECGLWTPTDHGYRIHDYLKYNDSSDELALRRAKDAERKASGRRNRWAVREMSARTPTDVQADAPTPSAGPDPTRPDPLRTTALKPLVDEQVVDPEATSQTRIIFDAWVAATDRPPNRTKLTADRRRVIDKALGSHGADDCLAAVKHIGADAWARGENDRGQRFDDVKHALGNAERIERWRDWTPRPTQINPDKTRQERRERRHQSLKSLMGATTTSTIEGSAE